MHQHRSGFRLPRLARCGCRERRVVAEGEASRRGAPGNPAGGQGCVAGHQFKRRDSLSQAIGQVVMPLAQHTFERRLLLRDPARDAVHQCADASRKAPTFSRTADGRSSFFTETGRLPRSATTWCSSSGALQKSPPTSPFNQPLWPWRASHLGRANPVPLLAEAYKQAYKRPVSEDLPAGLVCRVRFLPATNVF